jgi:hypothetical protein
MSGGHGVVVFHASDPAQVQLEYGGVPLGIDDLRCECMCIRKTPMINISLAVLEVVGLEEVQGKEDISTRQALW